MAGRLSLYWWPEKVNAGQVAAGLLLHWSVLIDADLSLQVVGKVADLVWRCFS
jgi:hypothetical protein